MVEAIWFNPTGMKNSHCYPKAHHSVEFLTDALLIRGMCSLRVRIRVTFSCCCDAAWRCLILSSLFTKLQRNQPRSAHKVCHPVESHMGTLFFGP